MCSRRCEAPWQSWAALSIGDVAVQQHERDAACLDLGGNRSRVGVGAGVAAVGHALDKGRLRDGRRAVPELVAHVR